MKHKALAGFSLALMAYLASVGCVKVSATVVNPGVGHLVVPNNVTSGESFKTTIRLQHPCYAQLRVYLDEKLKGIVHTICREYEKSFEFKNSDPQVFGLKAGWHRITVEEYSSGELVSYAESRVLVLPKAGGPPVLPSAVSVSTTSSTLASTTTSVALKEASTTTSTTVVSGVEGRGSVEGAGRSNTVFYVLLAFVGVAFVLASLMFRGVHVKRYGGR